MKEKKKITRPCLKCGKQVDDGTLAHLDYCDKCWNAMDSHEQDKAMRRGKRKLGKEKKYCSCGNVIRRTSIEAITGELPRRDKCCYCSKRDYDRFCGRR